MAEHNLGANYMAKFYNNALIAQSKFNYGFGHNSYYIVYNIISFVICLPLTTSPITWK